MAAETDSNVDWVIIAEKFRGIRIILSDMPTATSESELEEIKISKLAHSKDVTAQKIAYGQRMLVVSDEMNERLSALGADIANGDLFVSPFQDGRHAFEVIEEAIRDRRVTTDFLQSWGFVHQLLGRYVELTKHERVEEKLFKRKMYRALT